MTEESQFSDEGLRVSQTTRFRIGDEDEITVMFWNSGGVSIRQDDQTIHISAVEAERLEQILRWRVKG